MCEPLLPITALKDLRFSIASFAATAGTPGSYERRNAEVYAKGLRAELDWCIAQLEAAGEGRKNMGVRAYEPWPAAPGAQP